MSFWEMLLESGMDNPPATPLRSWRLSAGLSLEAVASAAGVTRQTLENWELGKHSPRATHIAKMAELAPGLVEALGLVPGHKGAA